MPDLYTPLLPGIGFSGYRSFATWQEFLFPTKVTVLAGINNSGKSNVLRFLHDIVPQLSPTGSGLLPKMVPLEELDRPRGFEGARRPEVGVPINAGQYGEPQAPRADGRTLGRALADFQEALIGLLARTDGTCWSRFVETEGQFASDPEQIEAAIAAWPRWNPTFSTQVLHALGGGSTNPSTVMLRLMASLRAFSSLPPVATISSSRRVETTGEDEPDWLSGRGIIRALAKLESPVHGEWGPERDKWHLINEFVRAVLGDDDASLNIPYDFSTIQVETPQRVLPLASLGGGVEQVIVLAAAATVITDSLVCVEEPETNMHPLLQKKLVRYLTDETSNQYIIATHSSHLLDDGRATSHHVRLTTEGSVATLVRKPHQFVAICNDLGYRPSDLLQANCVIWVEGPSDRIYLRRWIELVDKELSEAIDYSVMFYGGKLLAHLSASEEALTEFVQLRHLNRASAVVIDSDKTGPQSRINATKKRIKDEFEKSVPAPGFAWVTKCYTIENYVSHAVLSASVAEVHAGRTLRSFGQWDNPFKASKDSQFDKVGIATQAADRLTIDDMDVLDLRQRITMLCKFIRSANGQSTAPG